MHLHLYMAAKHFYKVWDLIKNIMIESYNLHVNR